jgi:hypothetical protein
MGRVTPAPVTFSTARIKPGAEKRVTIAGLEKKSACFWNGFVG